MSEAVLSSGTARRYPAETVEVRVLPDGRPLLLRPLVSKDAQMLQEFVHGLSPQSRYQRFQGGLNELAPDLLVRLMDLDYRRSMAFAAVVFGHGTRRMIGEARYAPALDGSGAAEFALAVSDRWQGQGLGAALFDKLLRYAERSGVARIQGDVLHNNSGMLKLAKQFGFSPRRHPDGAWLTRVERSLGAFAVAA
ncbi:MAG TPA: GNAT family N-acetyltransferase [Burkholderiales bacterium]|jgi:acetyltransferase